MEFNLDEIQSYIQHNKTRVIMLGLLLPSLVGAGVGIPYFLTQSQQTYEHRTKIVEPANPDSLGGDYLKRMGPDPLVKIDKEIGDGQMPKTTGNSIVEDIQAAWKDFTEP